MFKINSKVDKPDINYLYNRVSQMMKKGVKVGNLSELYSVCQNEMMAYKKDILVEFGINNPNSPAQVIDYLVNLNDQNVVEACTVDDKWTSNQKSLIIVESLGYKFATDIMQYRTVKKHCESIKSMIDSCDSEGRVHPDVSLTKTNRMSYKNPALMNVPKLLLWDCIVPSAPGNVLISADIKNQEPSILIHTNNVESLKPSLLSDDGLYEDIFKHIPVYGRLNIIVDNSFTPGIMSNKELAKIPNVPPIYYTPKRVTMNCIKYKGEQVKLIDIVNLVTPVGTIPELPKTVNIQTVSGNVYTVPIEFNVDFNDKALKKKINSMSLIEINGKINCFDIECKDKVRSEFKRSWNAMTYGSSIIGVKAMCRNIDGEIVYKYFSSIPELKSYRDDCTKKANSGCQIVYTYFGTQLNANEYNKKVLKRVLMDLPVQGTGSDILSLLVKHFDEESERRGYSKELYVYYTRHDELIIEATKSIVDRLGIDKIKAEIADLVIHQVDDWIPFKVEIDTIRKTDIKQIIQKSLDETED